MCRHVSSVVNILTIKGNPRILDLSKAHVTKTQFECNELV